MRHTTDTRARCNLARGRARRAFKAAGWVGALCLCPWLWLCAVGAPAQPAAPAQLGNPPAGQPGGQPASEGATTDEQSRDARILRHQERVKQILEERRQALERQKQAQEALARQNVSPELIQKVLDGRATAAELPQGVKMPSLAPPAAGQEPGAPAGGGEGPGAAIAMNLLLMMAPASVSTVAGETFDMSVLVLNDRYAPLDDIELTLRYAPDVLELEAVSDAKVRPLTAQSPDFEDNPQEGRIHYRARLARPHHFANETLLQMRWRARLPVVSTAVTFQHGGDGQPTTALRWRGEDRLGREDAGGDGALAGLISISAPHKQIERPLTASPMRSLRGGVRLRMKGPAEPVRTGDEFIVTVVIENPNEQVVDTVRAGIWFDPSRLEVVDWDRGNWIRRGINVHDGGARERYPFTLHNANTADNRTGEILYDMGVEDRWIPPAGDLFEIKFRALAPARETLLAFDILPQPNTPATALLCEGANVTDYAAMLEDNSVLLSLPIAPAAEPSAKAAASAPAH